MPLSITLPGDWTTIESKKRGIENEKQLEGDGGWREPRIAGLLNNLNLVSIHTPRVCEFLSINLSPTYELTPDPHTFLHLQTNNRTVYLICIQF